MAVARRTVERLMVDWACAARSFARRSVTEKDRARWIGAIGSSVRNGRTRSGFRIFTYVSIWRSGLYVVFVVDVFARRIVGWHVNSSVCTDFVLDALEQALYAPTGS